MSTFERCNIYAVERTAVVAHGGVGEIAFARLLDAGDIQGACNFVDVATLPVGASIGSHQHRSDEEEFYFVIAGQGRMTRDGTSFDVARGDLIRNPPGSTHGLINTGDTPLSLLVFEVAVR